MKTAQHYSHSFELKLNHLPCKASDRITLKILLPGIFCGLALMFLAFYDFSNGFLLSGKFDVVFTDTTGEKYDTFLSPSVFDTLIFLVGAWITASLFFSYIRYRKICFNGEIVQIIDRKLGGRKIVYSENIKNYEGVQMRIEFFQFGFINKNKYIIELKHRNLHKVAPLYISTSSKNIRSKWKYYAKSLNLPALILTDNGLVKRNVEDLDKSILTLFQEKKFKNEYVSDERLPDSVIVVRKKDKTIIKMAKILWDVYNKISWGIIVILAIIVLATMTFADDGSLSSKLFSYLSILILMVATYLLFKRDKIAIKKHKFVIVHKFPLKNLKKDEINKNEIEAIVVTQNPATGRFFLSITSQNKTVVFGKKMPAADLNWVRKFLINNIIKG